MEHVHKIQEFHHAMDKYNKHKRYVTIHFIISCAIVLLQLTLLANLILTWQSTSILSCGALIIYAYILADLINGLTHMYMDNNTHYTSIFGPFIAAFHLHHLKPQYTKKNPVKIYFYESGAKFWLVIYLLLILIINNYAPIKFELKFVLIGIGMFSSLAELSHYWCHSSGNNKLIQLLQKYGVLLSKKHHSIHHVEDNKNYAFLNGISDPLINTIAKWLYKGYKNNADLHVKAYNGPQTGNRQ